MKRVMMLVAVVGGIVQMAVGADTHDYSNYAKLTSKSTTVTVTTHWPTADQWTPAGEMSADGYYLIPKGKTLYCNSQAATPCDGPWPAAELAVEGAFRSSTTGGRANTPETAHLAILPGGKIYGTAAYSTFTAETLDIRGTADSPSVIEYSYYADTSKPNYYLLINAVLTSSDSDSVVKFVNPKTTDYSFKQRATRILGVRDFLGTVVVEGSNAWVRLETTATEFDLAGTLELKNGGNVYVDTVSPTIGTLKIGAGSTFEVAKKRAVTVTDALELAEGTRILVANPFGDWTTGTPKDPVRIATFGPDVERPSDYRSIFDVPLPSNAVGAIPDIVFSEVENNDGSVDIFVSYREIVDFTGNGSAAVTPFRQTSPDYSKLRDLSPISTEKDYYALNKNLYVIDWAPTYVYEFIGHSLTLDGTGGKLAVYDGITFVCTNLYLAGSRLTQQKAGSWARFDGNIYAQGGKVSFAGAAGVEIKSDIHGSSDLKMYRAGDTDNEDFTKTSHVYLRGDNSDFSGRFLFGEFVWTNTADHVSELHVWEKANLGGAMPEVTSNGVMIADTCSLVYNGGAETFDEVTRGWTFEGASGLNLVLNVAVKVRNTITVADTLTKRGAGTLVAADVDGSALVIAAGGLGAASPEAFKGLSALAFAAGTKFVVNASADDSLKAAGADLSATALTVPAGGVPVEFVNVPKSGCALTVATFATEAEAAKFVFKRPRGYTVKRTVEAVEGGAFALRAEIEESGFLLLIGSSRTGQMPRTVFASDLGYDEEDSTACLQRALDSGAQRVVIDRMDGPWITQPLFITNSNVTVLLEDGVVLMAKRGAFKGVSDCLVTVKGASNVFFGSDGHAVLEMHKADYCDPGKGYTPAEWRCALSLQSSQDVTVRNLTLKSSGGDGVYVKGMKNVVLENLVSIDNHRQGMSPIGVEGMTVRNCVFNDTVGTAPQSGVDMEPNSASDAFTDVVYEDCTFNGNAGYGVKLDFHKLTGLSQPVSIVFRRCEMKNNSGNSGVFVVGGSQTVYGDAGPVTGSVLFEDCTVAGNANGAVRVSDLVEGGVTLAFRNCTFDARGMSASAALRFSSPDVPRDVGSVSFENCGLWIDAGKDVMTSASFAGYGITEAFGGTLTVHSGGTERAFDFAAFRAANAPDPDRVVFVPAVVDYGRLAAPEGDAALAGTYSPRLRGDFTFVQAVSGAGTCKVKFNAESESGKASGGAVVYGKCTVRDHAGKVVGKFNVGGGETVHDFAASAGEVYRFEMTRSNSGLIRVAGTVPGCGIVADGLVPLYKEAGAVLYFRVPAAARRVMVFAATDDSATVEVLDSTGTVRDSVQMSSKLRSYGKVMAFDREATAADEIWSVRCPQMSADCLIRIGGDALPFLSPESSALPRLL